MPLYVTLFAQALSVVVACLFPLITWILIVTLITAVGQAGLQLEDTALSLLPKTITMIFLIMVFGLHLLDGIERLMRLWIEHGDRLVRQPWA